MSSSTKVKAVRDLLGNQSMPYGERRRLLVDMIIQAGLPVPVEVTSGARAKYGSLRAESWKFLLSLDLGDAQREYLRMVKLGDVPERIRILHDIKAAKERKDQLAKITSWATVKRVLTATMWYLNQLLREKPSLLQGRRSAGKESIFVYTQGLASICALLLTTVPEEEAFAALVVLLTTWFPAYFTPNVDGLRRGCSLVSLVLEQCDPELHEKLSHEHPLYANHVVAPLLRTFLACRSPVKDALRLFDAVLAQGPSMLILLAAAKIHCRRKQLLNDHGSSALLRLTEISNGEEYRGKSSTQPSARTVLAAAMKLVQALPSDALEAMEAHPQLSPPSFLFSESRKPMKTPPMSPVQQAQERASAESTMLRGRPRPGQLLVRSPSGEISQSATPPQRQRDGALTPPTPKPSISLEGEEMKSPGSNIGWWNREDEVETPSPTNDAQKAEGESSPLPPADASGGQPLTFESHDNDGSRREEGVEEGESPLRRSLLTEFTDTKPQAAPAVEFSPFVVPSRNFIFPDASADSSGESPVPLTEGRSVTSTSSSYAHPRARFAGPTLAWVQHLLNNAEAFRSKGLQRPKPQRKKTGRGGGRSPSKGRTPYSPRLKGYLWSDESSVKRTRSLPPAIKVDSDPGHGGIVALQPLYPCSVSPDSAMPRSRFLNSKKPRRPASATTRKAAKSKRSGSLSTDIRGRPLPWEPSWQSSAWQGNVWVRSQSASGSRRNSEQSQSTREGAAEVPPSGSSRSQSRSRPHFLRMPSSSPRQRSPQRRKSQPQRQPSVSSPPRPTQRVASPPSLSSEESSEEHKANTRSRRNASEATAAATRPSPTKGHDLSGQQGSDTWARQVVEEVMAGPNPAARTPAVELIFNASRSQGEAPRSSYLQHPPVANGAAGNTSSHYDPLLLTSPLEPPADHCYGDTHLPLWSAYPRVPFSARLQAAGTGKKTKKPKRGSKPRKRAASTKARNKAAAAKSSSGADAKPASSKQRKPTKSSLSGSKTTTKRSTAAKKPKKIPQAEVSPRVAQHLATSHKSFNLSPKGKPMGLEWGMRTALSSGKKKGKGGSSPGIEELLDSGLIDAPAATAATAEEATLAAEAAAGCLDPSVLPASSFTRRDNTIGSLTTPSSTTSSPRYFERLVASIGASSTAGSPEGKRLVRIASQKANQLFTEEYQEEKGLLERFLAQQSDANATASGNAVSRPQPLLSAESLGTASINEDGSIPPEGSDGFLARLRQRMKPNGQME